MAAPVLLMIRDGWGISRGGREAAEAEGNATLLAKTPFHDHMYATYPMGRLSASGMDVGLPDGQMGNSEVGHLNLGAGRIVYQDFTRINKAIADGELDQSPVLQKAFEQARSTRLHFLGLVSDGGVHSHQKHLIALADPLDPDGVFGFIALNPDRFSGGAREGAVIEVQCVSWHMAAPAGPKTMGSRRFAGGWSR